jgi:hypothetical protein
MTPPRLPVRLHLYLLVAAVAACLWIAGCASVKKGADTGGGAAVGAGIGLLGGPIASVGGAAIGAVAGGAMADSDAFGSGDVVGEEALRKQRDFWRAEAVERSSAAGFLQKILWWCAGVGALYFAFRNRAHIVAFARGGGFKQLAHAVIGGKVGKA